MNARELLQYELEQVGKQIEACLNGMSEAGFDARCSDKGMTPREMLVHVAEAYLAFVTVVRGEKHEWGSFKIEDQSTDNVRRVFSEMRSQAVSTALASDDDAVQKEAYDYIVGHDNYHVAQLVLARLQVEPEWNAYGIYG